MIGNRDGEVKSKREKWSLHSCTRVIEVRQRIEVRPSLPKIPLDLFRPFRRRLMRHVLSALVQNQPGVLAHISGMLASRGFNIDSLAVGEPKSPISRA